MENKDLLKKSMVFVCVSGNLISSMYCSRKESHYCAQTKPYQDELAERYASNSDYPLLHTSVNLNAISSTATVSNISPYTWNFGQIYKLS